MRLFLLVLFCLFAMPVHAQRIFRASPIDAEQDRRIDSLEDRLAGIEQSLARMIAPEPDPDPVPDAVIEPEYVKPGDIKTINGKLHTLKIVDGNPRWMPPAITTVRTQPVTVSATVQSGRYTTAELKSIAASYRGPMEATVEPRSWARTHLQNDHGFSSSQVAGLTINEAITIHSMAHGGRITPFRSARSVAPAVTESTVTRERPFRTVERKTVVYEPQGGCPNGQCPTSRTVQPARFRLFPGLFR